MAYPQGGFDCDFIHAIPDSLLCPVCLLVVRDPHILSCCGVKICQTCLATYKTRSPSSRGPQCPKCRQYFQNFQDKEASRQILDLKVRCSRKDDGCNWEGELRYLDKHERETCKWVLVRCRHPECGLNVPRLHLSTHERHECAHRPVDDQLEKFKSKMNQRYLELDSKLTALTGQTKKCNKNVSAEVTALTTQIEESDARMISKMTDLATQVNASVVNTTAEVTDLRGRIRKAELKLSNRVIDLADELEDSNRLIDKLRANAAQMEETFNLKLAKQKAANKLKMEAVIRTLLNTNVSKDKYKAEIEELKLRLRALENQQEGWENMVRLSGAGEVK